MSSDVLDRMLRRAGTIPLTDVATHRDVVKVDLQNVNDHLATLQGGTPRPFVLDYDALGAVMWPWTRALAFWRSSGHGDGHLADYAALVRAYHHHRCYDGLLFRLLPNSSSIDFMGWGGVRCIPDGRIEFRATPQELPDSVLSEFVGTAFLMLGRPPLTDAETTFAIQRLRGAADASSYLTTILAFAARFANCRNVVQLERASADSTPKPWLRSGHPRYSYRVLAIDPDALHARKSETPPSGRHGVSLHICRGHFATYSAERPLFGKHTGTYWIPQHARGDAALGYAEKSYAIHRPAAKRTQGSGSGR